MLNLWTKDSIEFIRTKWLVTYNNGYLELILNHKRYDVETISLILTDLEYDNHGMTELEVCLYKHKMLSGLLLLQRFQENDEEKRIN